MQFKNNMLEVIGNTPLVKLQEITKGLDANVFLKLEYMNPSGSYKDHAAKYMIEQAEKTGALKPGGIILDSTTGNFGPGLAFVGHLKGYRVRLLISQMFMPKPDRLNIMKSWGAEVLVKPQPSDEILSGASEEERGLLDWVMCKKYCYDLRNKDLKIWWADQITNMDNKLGHQYGQGLELVQQTGGDVHTWVASAGSAGTLWGVADAFREKGYKPRVVAVIPEDFPLFKWNMEGRWEYWVSKIGLPYPKTIIKRMMEEAPPDEIVVVKDKDARNMTNRLVKEEGVFCGFSTGANVFAAVELAKKLGPGHNVATVAVDWRYKYVGEYPKEHYVV